MQEIILSNNWNRLELRVITLHSYLEKLEEHHGLELYLYAYDKTGERMKRSDQLSCIKDTKGSIISSVDYGKVLPDEGLDMGTIFYVHELDRTDPLLIESIKEIVSLHNELNVGEVKIALCEKNSRITRCSCGKEKLEVVMN